MGDTNVPATSKAEVSGSQPAQAEVSGSQPAQAEVSSEIESLRGKLAEAQARAERAEKAFNAAQRKGKTADELQAQLEEREEEFTRLGAELEKREKLFRQTLKPRLEALPEHTRKLVELAGKEGSEALLAALELAEKDARPVKHEPQAGALPGQGVAHETDWNRRWDRVLRAK